MVTLGMYFVLSWQQCHLLCIGSILVTRQQHNSITSKTLTQIMSVTNQTEHSFPHAQIVLVCVLK